MPPRRTPSYAGFAPSSAAASAAKRANRKEGGRAERLLGRAMWRRGLRYRKHVGALPGRPDFAFPRARVCVFCDGDFWHGRDWDVLRERLARRANADYWIAKLERNRERDQEQTRVLKELGWTVVRVWETDVLRNWDSIAAGVDELLRAALRRHRANAN
jgi:DNA mismatch endonuclease (patch repair protein)